MPQIIKNFMNKEINTQVKILDDSTMTLDHCISDDVADRVGDDMDTKGWQLENYKLNPVVLDGHDYSKPPVGKNLKLYTKGNQLRAVTQFAPTDEGKKYYQLYKDGYMSAFSVGFIPKEYDINKTGGYHMKKHELLEYSVVTVPCNPRAIKSFLIENNKFEEEDGMKEEEVNVLIKSAIDASIKDLTVKHQEELDAKVKEIEDLNVKVKEIDDLNAKIKEMEDLVAEKAGASISAATKQKVSAINTQMMDACQKCLDYCKQLDDFIGGSGEGMAEGEKSVEDNIATEKDYSDSEIQEMVSNQVQKILDDAVAAKGGK